MPMYQKVTKNFPALKNFQPCFGNFFRGCSQRISAFIYYRFPPKGNGLIISDTSHRGISDRGLFSILRETLDIIAANGEKNISINYNNTPYNDSSRDNMWEYYFEPVNNTIKKTYDTSFLRIRAYIEQNPGKSKEHLRLFNSVLRDRIVIKKNLVEIAEKFQRTNFNGKKIIAVHFRGTDISRAVNYHPETSQKASAECYFVEIDRLLQQGFDSVFLATDDQNIFDSFSQRYGSKLLFYSKHRSSSKLALHFYHSERYGKQKASFGKREIGEEVIIDTLLLSKTNYFLHGNSNVPVFVQYLNPNLTAKNMDILENNGKTRGLLGKIAGKIGIQISNLFNSLRPKKIWRTALYHLGVYRALGTNVKGLNLGAGSITIDGFWNLDSRFPFKSTTLVAGVEKINLEDCSVEAVYCAHIFEHLDRTKKVDTLKEWHRILKPGGALYIAVPNIEVLSQMYLDAIKNYDNDLNKNIADRVMRIVHGGQSFPQDKHFYGYSFVTLKHFLNMAGFDEVELFDARNLPFSRNKDDDSLTFLNNTLISLNLKAIK